MANSGPDTNGSQFFITYSKQPHLNGVYTIFGRYVPISNRIIWCRVIHGMETLDAMERVPVDKKDKPLQEIKLERVTIHANPLA